MRTPNLNVGSRVPTINPVAPRTTPNIAARPDFGVMARPHSDLGGRSTLSAGRFPTNSRSTCQGAGGGADGECLATSADSGKGGSGKTLARKGKGGSEKGSPQAAFNLRSVPNELVAEIDGALSTAEADELARRHGLERIASQNFPLIGGTIGLFRIVDRRPVDVVRRELAADGSVRSVQLNLLHFLQQTKKPAMEGDAAQYAVAQLRLPQAHAFVRGMNVTIAVIDSGIDARHPELANSVADSFDALGSSEGPHIHGTGIAGAIVAHGRLMGSAPEARLLAIRAFGKGSKGPESTSYVILRGLNYVAEHGAQIINMSFAGPKDPLIERGIAATAARGILMVAAAGNAGAKSPPLYPAAYPNVIAVSGTDAQERLFSASNRGSHIAVAAPGADIFLPAPDEKYQITSGTSFSAAYVSGVAALMLERNPALKPSDVRAILTKTARDLGVPGRDDQFGAGEADAFAAVTAAAAALAVPLASTGKPAGEKTPALDPSADNASVSRALNDSPPSMAAEKSAANAAK
ncbi:S8 family serine peptidase [Bradyrhizobium roseum]|nr:S8 family serine peptidase [Bradyrhizobium roseus]WKA31954.1 S8 family serine peptidase [Bradyrhizobium roseus]